MALASVGSFAESLQKTVEDYLDTLPIPPPLKELATKAIEYISKNKSKSIFGTCVTLLILRYPYLYIKRRYIQRLPPGPIGLPIIGSLHTRMASIPGDGYFFVKLAEQYGPCSTYFSGSVPVITLNHYELVKQVYVENQLNDRRPRDYGARGFSIVATGHGLGAVPFLFVNGDAWKRRRKYAFDLLTSMPSSVVHEITDISLGEAILPRLSTLSNNDEEWIPGDDLIYLAMNTLYHYSVGIPCQYTDNWWKDFANVVNDTFAKTVPSLWLVQFPFLQNTSYANQYNEIITRRTNMIISMVEKREELLNSNNNNNNNSILKDTYIDGMLKHNKNGELTRDELISDIGVLFLAGSDTTSSTTEISIMMFAKYINMQNRFREICNKLWELNNKPMIGKNNEYKAFRLQMLLGSDNKQLKNEFKAFIYELMRVSTVAGHGISHQNTSGKDITINVKKEYGTLDGKDHTYIIPKNGVLMSNTEYIHRYSNGHKEWKHNTKRDESNYDFCIENWFENGDIKNGKLLKTSSMPYVPFGLGNRICPGQQLAGNEHKVFIATLILNFKFEFDKNKYGNNPLKIPFKMKRVLTTTIKTPNSVKVTRV